MARFSLNDDRRSTPSLCTQPTTRKLAKKPRARVFVAVSGVVDGEEVLGHELAEALLVILGGNDGGGRVFGDDQGRLDPRLQLLVPRVLTQIVDDPEHHLLSLLVHSHQQRVIHDVYRLKHPQPDIEPLDLFKHVKRGKREEPSYPARLQKPFPLSSAARTLRVSTTRRILWGDSDREDWCRVLRTRTNYNRSSLPNNACITYLEFEIKI